MAGIGCHSMALFMPDRHTATLTHMGGEGVNWIGQAPFTTERHVFQNLGDGTYAHSGLMAIRAAAAAGVNITYKILYNDAVAMTGGQPVEGAMTVAQIAQQVLAEGARRVVVVADEPGKYPKHAGFPAGVAIRHRDDLDAVQRELRDIAGLTVLIYDQTCAAEKRRRRKRGKFPDPPERVFINDAVCEGCGDCSDKSNCIAGAAGRDRVRPQAPHRSIELQQGFFLPQGLLPELCHRARRHAAQARRARGERQPVCRFAGAESAAARAALRHPRHRRRRHRRRHARRAHRHGGASRRQGLHRARHQRLAQKNGAVMSHVRLAPQPEDLYAVRVASGGADVLLACDPVVAASPAALSRIQAGTTKAIINSHAQPTAAFIFKPDIDFETAKMLHAIKTAAGDGGADSIDATGLAAALMGDSIAANLFMLGYAFQKGLVPLSLAAIARAIELNGVAVDTNKRSFAWGRLAAHDRAQVEALVRGALRDDAAPEPQGLDALVEHRAAFLKNYQNAAYAQRYRDAVRTVRIAEAKLARGFSGLAEAVARNLFTLMAYKDEYEVARLYTDGAFIKKLQRQFDGDFTLEYHLAPPLLARRDPATGEPKKRAFGPWMRHVFKLLARLRPLRGTALDIFGYTQERRMERRLIADYEALLRELSASLSPDNHALAVEIASLPAKIRGFGHIKARNVESAKACEAELAGAAARQRYSGVRGVIRAVTGGRRSAGGISFGHGRRQRVAPGAIAWVADERGALHCGRFRVRHRGDIDQRLPALGAERRHILVFGHSAIRRYGRQS